MNRRWIVPSLACATAVAVVAAAAGTAWTALGQLGRIEARLERIDRMKSGEEAVARFLSRSPMKASEYFCGLDSGSPLCLATTPRSYENLGSHDAVWVMLDAAAQLSASARMDVRQRRHLERLYADLVGSLSAGGALAKAQSGDEFPDVLMVNDLRDGALAQAAACASGHFEGCKGGFPEATARSLAGIARFVARIGPETAPYETGYRMPAVALLFEIGLLPDGPNPGEEADAQVAFDLSYPDPNPAED